MQQLSRAGTNGSMADHIKLFVITTSDIYFAKAELYDYLPLMVKKATRPSLKSAILNVAISVSGQLLRLNFILASLKQVLLAYKPLVHEMVDLEKYLQRELDGISNYSTDILLLVHLTIVETKEIEAFKLLQKLAVKVNNKTTTEHLVRNVEDAINSKKLLDQLMDLYMK